MATTSSARKRAEDVVAEAHIDDTDENCKCNGHQAALENALTDTVGFVCTVILTNICLHSDTKGHQRQNTKVIQFGCSRICGDLCGTQGVQGKLYNDSSQSNDRALEPYGQPQLEMQLPIFCCVFEMPQTNLQNGYVPFDIKNAEKAGKELRHKGGDGCAFYPHTQVQDESPVQNDI